MSTIKTPLRYPGGKQRLTPFVLELLQTNGLIGGHYVEPYAGGAGVAIELLLGGHVEHIHLNDASFAVYCVWNGILNHTEEFCDLIRNATLSVDEWRRQREIMRNPQAHSRLNVGFATFYLNRCNRSGVLSAGVIGGLEQEGRWKIDARFPRNELITRIEAIALFRDQITLCNFDAELMLTHYVPILPRHTLVYCDPPYFVQGNRLYLNHYSSDDHQRLSTVIQRAIRHHWIVSYDAAQAILEYYEERRKFTYDLQYNAARAYKGREVFIFSDEVEIPRTSKLPYITAALHEHFAEAA